MSKTTQRYSLNAKQIHVLKLLYKFRFVTASLLARYKGVSRISSNKTLTVLFDQQYVGKRYDRSYKIQGKGASYYLATKALTYLRDNHQMNDRVLHTLYKNKSVGSSFIDHNLDTFKAYLSLRDSYPDTYHIFTKTELGDYDYFPELRPDLYLNRINPLDDAPSDYMMDIFTDTQLFIIKKRIGAYIEHFESGDWEAEADTVYPVILIACPNPRMEEKLQRLLEKTLDGAGIDDLKFYTTTVKALIGSGEANKVIWSNTAEPETLLAL